ncbi:hypothetical protein ESCO_005344 [Escovopsis weberi]|uniref:RBR-type E3 ubiquitin transferase n=1 Tax=Escovopsis weberi TaxID=150374 RepID=A0A0M8N5T9_ESCWE|nr:hypothetical protein ESCO_005344 [Escovopsis weberi]
MADIDQESLDLIIQLQLQDVEGLVKGKSKQYDAPNDIDLAMQLYQAELESLNSFFADRAMTMSIARAVLQDADAIAEQIRPEEPQRPAVNGKQPAADDPPPTPGFPGEGPDEEMLARLQAMYMDNSRSVAGDAAESSSWAALRKQPASAPAVSGGGGGQQRASPRRNCTACRDSFPASEMARCPCSHEYCGDCLRELFSAAMKDESLFPPRCCRQPIPLEANQTFLTAKIQDDFRAKSIEYGTPNRTYCHEPTCSAFISTRFIFGDRAYCDQCGAVTCTTCKGAAHDEDCSEDASTQEVLRLARENGWQRCQGCKSMVELNTGCNHMTCRCGSQFCYICGVQWKKCACPQWDEDFLVERAANVVNRDAAAVNYDAAQRERAERQAQRDLRDYHNCVVHRWGSRQGQFRCEYCRDRMPEYIYECNGCRALACRRCRFNRL